jgi:catalase
MSSKGGSMDEKDKKKLTTFAGAPVPDNQNCMKADPAYGKGVAQALGISVSEV